MDIKYVNTFVEIMNTGSFSAAAKKLDYGQSTITGHIRNLERELGAGLFNRAARVNTPTREAYAFLPHARRMLAAQKDALDLMSSLSGRMEGEVVLGTTQAVWVRDLIDRIVSFSQECPKIVLTVKQVDFREVVHVLKENRIDLALVTCQPIRDPFIRIPACREETMALAFPSGKFGGEKPTTDQLLAERFIVNWKGCVFRTMLERRFQRWGGVPALMEVDSVSTMKELCASDLGISYLPLYAIEEERRRGQFECLVLEQDDEEKIATQILAHRDRVVAPPVCALCETLMGLLEGQRFVEKLERGGDSLFAG